MLPKFIILNGQRYKQAKECDCTDLRQTDPDCDCHQTGERGDQSAIPDMGADGTGAGGGSGPAGGP